MIMACVEENAETSDMRAIGGTNSTNVEGFYLLIVEEFLFFRLCEGRVRVRGAVGEITLMATYNVCVCNVL